MKIIRDQSELVLWLADIISERPPFITVHSAFCDSYIEMAQLVADIGQYDVEDLNWEAVQACWAVGPARRRAIPMSRAALGMLVDLTAMNIKNDVPVPVQYYVGHALDLIEAEEDVIQSMRSDGLWVQSTAAFELRFQTKLRVLCTG